jgi:alkyldihydroxyacetonephosphate synthase
VTDLEMHPTRWGDPARATTLPETARGLVELAFPTDDRTVADDAAVTLPPVALGEEVLAAFTEVLGAGPAGSRPPICSAPGPAT